MTDVFPYELLADVAATGSISETARRHRLSQAAVSARMSALERALRVRLLVRSATGATPTAAGADVLAHARPLLEAARALDAYIDSARGVSPVLRVAASSTVAEHLVPGRLARLREQSPEVRIEVRSTNSVGVVAAVRAGEVDLGFVEDEQPPSDTDHCVVDHDELVVLVAPDHPWARRDTVAPAELAASSLITREVGSGARTVFESRLRAHGRDHVGVAAPRTELTSNTAIKNAAISGLGVAVLSSLVAAEELAAGRLQRVHVDGLDLRRDLHAVWPRDRPLAALARALVPAPRPSVTRSVTPPGGPSAGSVRPGGPSGSR